MKPKFFNTARAVSRKSPSEVKVGAVIVKGNAEISVGFNNMKKTHPKSPHPFKTIHAEFDAILGVDPADLEGATIYVFREFKDGTRAMSKPCEFCEAALRSAGIHVCYYTGHDSFERIDYVDL